MLYKNKVHAILDSLKAMFHQSDIDETQWMNLCSDLFESLGDNPGEILEFIKELEWDKQIFIDDIYDELTEKFSDTELHLYLNDLSEKILQYFIDLNKNS